MPNLGELIIDNIIFEGGNTSDDENVYVSQRAGGGIYSLSALAVSNCTFRNNFGRSGASLCVDNVLRTVVEPVTILASNFENNVSTSQSAGPIFFNCPIVNVGESYFANNLTNRGCCYPVECEVFNLFDCSFESNINLEGFGGALFTWQVPEINIERCSFVDNSSANAGACYFDTRNLSPDMRNISIKNSTFENNMATSGDGGFGGSIYAWTTNLNITDSEFIANRSTNSAGAVYISGDGSEALIDKVNFEENFGAFGGALVSYGEVVTTINNSTFSNNNATNGGGCINNGFRSTMIIENGSFLDNTSDFGGAITMQNDTSALTIKGSSFLNNISTSGGALAIFGSTNGPINILDSKFENNLATTGAGIFLQGHAGSPRVPFNIVNTRFTGNDADTQGGAVNIVNAEGTMVNCLMTNNQALGVGTGGAISLNADSLNTELILQHCTIVENQGTLSSGIAVWGIGGVAAVRMRNSILDNDRGEDFAIEDGQGRFISDGGNFVGHFNLIDSIDLSQDVFDPSSIMVDKADGNYYLKQGSLCIDKGLVEWAIADDLKGQIRDEDPDIGCFEFDPELNVFDESFTVDMKIYPNPTVSNISVSSKLNGLQDLMIFNSSGELVIKKKINTFLNYDVSQLPAGSYYLKLDGNNNYQGRFVKIDN